MYTAKIINPNNTFTLGWKDGVTYVFSEENHENDITDEAKEYLETYLDITNKPLFTFVKKEEVVEPVVTPKVIKKAVE